MLRIKHGTAVATAFLTRSVPLLSMAFVVLFAATGQAQQDRLSFFKNYFITGDYVVRGVSLWRKGVRGKAVAEIPKLGGPDGVTPGADIVAAFLYIQTAEKIQGSGIDHVKFGATPKASKPFFANDFGPFYAPGSNVPGSGSIAKGLNWDLGTVPCWSVLFPGGGRRLVTYRTDVLRFLPIDKATGKQALNTSFRVVVPDFGIDFGDDDESSRERQDRHGPRAVGASLVVVYRDPAKPYKAVVIYDGGLTKRAFATMNQTIQGFYDASTGAPVPKSAKMTHIVGDGRPFLSERVLLNNQAWTNPFKSADGPKWDNWTVNVALPNDASSANVRVEPHSLLSDCVSWSAIVLSTNVQDTDGDGLLDRWETEVLQDPHNQPLPNLAAMGADPNAKDLFVEVGYLHADQETSYGGVPKPAHTHLPSEAALNMVGDAFKNAPVTNPDLSVGIKVHFDVGNIYQTSPYVIPAGFARGGEAIAETACDAADPACQFPNHSGTVGWKRGFRFLRDQILSEPQPPIPPITGEEDQCDAPGNPCERRFDRNRRDMFRYALFAHALGLPKAPCLNPDGSANATCQVTNPEFKIPRTNTGIADFPGGDLMVTLGAFDDSDGIPVGTNFMQASTLMHELGHTFELTHAGVPLIPREPNCKPNYLSVMNYLFQLRGLINDAGAPVLDFSSQRLPGLDEFTLMQGVGLGTDLDFPHGPARFRTGWYAPKLTSYLNPLGAEAKGHCDGSPLLRDPVTNNLLEPPMVRVDATSAAGAIDWNANGQTLDAVSPQDINFNGVINADPFTNPPPPQLNAGSNDWVNIFLNQVGGRRNVGGIFADPAASGRLTLGPLSLDVGRSDIGRSDIGRSDIGRSDIGRSDIGRSDIGSGDLGRGDTGRSDIGRSDIGRSDIGRGDFGGGDLDVGGPNEPAGELDLETFRAAVGNTPTPPNTLQACLTSDFACTSEGGDRPVRVNWQAPHVGRAVRYFIYRLENASDPFVAPATLPTTPIATVESQEGPPATTHLDLSAWGDGRFAYFVTAQFDDGSLSGISNFATITTPAATLPPGSVLPLCGDQDPTDEDPLVFNCPTYRALPNLQQYEVPANATQLQFDLVYRNADFNNELAAFKVDDATGAIGALHPGDAGYLAAALARARVIFASGSNASTADATVRSLPVTGAIQGGDRLVLFLVQDSTLAALKHANPGNSIAGAPLAFFSLNSLNPDAYDHVFAFEDTSGSTEFGFEDLTFGGDQDFDDMVITVSPWNP